METTHWQGPHPMSLQSPRCKYAENGQIMLWSSAQLLMVGVLLTAYSISSTCASCDCTCLYNAGCCG